MISPLYSPFTAPILCFYDSRKNDHAFFVSVEGWSRWIELSEAMEMEGVQGDWEDRDGELILAEGGKPDGSWSAIRKWGP